MTDLQPLPARPAYSVTPHGADHVRPARPDEFGWLVHSWSEGYKLSPGCRKMSWRDYKALQVPELRAALQRPDTTVLVAADGADCGLGWMAFARWPSIDIVHWVYVTMAARRHGVMARLLGSLRDRVTYTHRGVPMERGARRSDEWITDLLRKRGTTGEVMGDDPERLREWLREALEDGE